jgi:OOP family OmpA-OmpF porin
MHMPRSARLSLLISLLGGAVFAGCGGPIVFEGQSALNVAGEPPPPPPPPPKKEEPPPPPKPPARVEVRSNKIEIREKIQFEYNKATIKEESHSLLNEIVDVIKKNPHIKKIAIEGHASSEGNDAYNLRLSDQRAKSVMKYLVDNGIADATLEAKGYGETKPIADNESEEGREKNRRVEFNIVEQDETKRRIEVDPTTGEERAISVEEPAGGAQPAQTPKLKAPPKKEDAKP